jgi:predicted aldo/keto reductase-like oxidoreductase
MKRRTFVEKCFSGGIALTAFPLFGRNRKTKPQAEFPKRTLGKTGEKLSIIGFGGILLNNVEQERANNMVASAFDRGIIYYDVAPTYGNAEEHLGPALKPYRDKCFLACKTQERDKAGAEKELHESLKKLKTDFFDLYQLHALTTKEDVEKALGPNGAMETFLKARQEGKIRFIGFSAHSQEAALLAMDNFDFDTILFPINFVCWNQANFGPQAVKKAKEKKMGILAIKGLAFTSIPEGAEKPYERLWYIPVEDKKVSNLALRFTLSQGITAAIPPGDPGFWDTALDTAQNFTPISTEEVAELKRISTGVASLFQG